MAKNEVIMKKITQSFDSLSNFLNKSGMKYLSLLCANYLEFIHDSLSKNYSQASESLLSSILAKSKDLSTIIDNLESAGFFKGYGLYQKNEKIGSMVEKIANTINEILDLAQPLFKETPCSKLNLALSVRIALDKAVELCNQKIAEKKPEKKKAPGELARNLEAIDDELTFIFWFHHLALEGDIDDKEFLKNFGRVMEILGKDIKNLDREKLLNEVDQERGNAICPKDINKFVKFGLTYPLTVYDLPGDQVDNESDGEKTLKRIKKPKENKKEEDNDDDDENDEAILWKRKSTKSDLSKYQQEEDKNKNKDNDKQKEKDEEKEEEETKLRRPKIKKVPIDINSIPVIESVIVSVFDKPLVLNVIEVNEKEPGLFKVGSKIKITKTTYQIDEQEKHELRTKYVAKFGRESNEEQYQSDIKLAKLNEISRKQFQILSNDQIQNIYKIVCTSPPPKTETSFKISDQPFLLHQDNVIILLDERKSSK